MPVFIVPMVAGLIGLVAMALPGLSRHGGSHAHAGHTGHVGHAGHAGHTGHLGHAAHTTHGLQAGKSPVHAAPGHASAGHVAPGHAAPTHAGAHAPAHPAHAGAQHGILGSHSVLEILDPRLLCSLMALFGATGQIAYAAGLSPGWSAVLAVPAALGLEWAVVGRLWRLALSFQGQPESPMDTLLFDEVEAVTLFHNGKGMVRAVKDGRSVQLVAHLQDDEGEEPVRTGDRLRITGVDPENEKVTVTRI